MMKNLNSQTSAKSKKGFILVLFLSFILYPLSFAEAAFVTYACDRCTPSSGFAVGTTSWSISNLTLAPGVNIITVVATDDNGNSSPDTITVTFAPTFPGNTLAGAWGFAAGSGTTAIDSSGNSNTATFVNTPTWQTAGRYDKALSFDGTTQSLSVADANSLDFTQSFTLSAWVNPSVVHTDYRAVISKDGSTPSSGPPYRMYASVDAFTCPATGNGSIAGLVAVNGSSGPEYVVCDTPLAIGVWTHIATTYDGTSLKMYRNGVLRSTVVASGIIEPTTGLLEIATSQYAETFQGALDEVRTYNYALPVTAGSNTVPGAACVRNQTASVVGDMNCSVVAPTNILAIKIPASTTAFSITAGKTTKFGSH